MGENGGERDRAAAAAPAGTPGDEGDQPTTAAERFRDGVDSGGDRVGDRVGDKRGGARPPRPSAATQHHTPRGGRGGKAATDSCFGVYFVQHFDGPKGTELSPAAPNPTTKSSHLLLAIPQLDTDDAASALLGHPAKILQQSLVAGGAHGNFSRARLLANVSR